MAALPAVGSRCRFNAKDGSGIHERFFWPIAACGAIIPPISCCRGLVAVEWKPVSWDRENGGNRIQEREMAEGTTL